MSGRSYFAKDVLAMMTLLGWVAIAVRLVFGLGTSTALSDAVPWGLWKILNMVAGVALATGGFTLACGVYVLGLEKYRPMLRPAILTAFLGYGSSCFALALDIGLPHRIWHPLVHWNVHSFLFEVAWCVMLYFSVTGVEMTPIILEKFHYPRVVRWLHRATIPVVITGVTLSTLHHTSLGSLFLVAPSRLHELWYTSWLPLLFFVSAIGSGMMTVVLLTLLYGWLQGRAPRYAPLRGVAGVAAVVLALFLVLKLVDIARRDAWEALGESAESPLFVAELALAAFLPSVLMAIRKARHSPVGLATAAVSAAAGLILNRLNVGIFGFFSSSEAFYCPTVPEWALSLGVIAMAGLVFLYVAEKFEIFEGALEPVEIPAGSTPIRSGELRPLWQSNRYYRLRHSTLLPVFVVPLAVLLFWNDAVRGYPLRRAPVLPPTAMDETRAVLRIDGDGDADFVLFDHRRHQTEFGAAESCRLCHHAYFPLDPQTPCYRCHSQMSGTSSIFDHDRHAASIGYRKAHGMGVRIGGGATDGRVGGRLADWSGPQVARWENLSCLQCHSRRQPRQAETAETCTTCHGLDMGLTSDEGSTFNRWAMGYVNALHKRCISCHETEGPARGRFELPQCATCHSAASSL